MVGPKNLSLGQQRAFCTLKKTTKKKRQKNKTTKKRQEKKKKKGKKVGIFFFWVTILFPSLSCLCLDAPPLCPPGVSTLLSPWQRTDSTIRGVPSVPPPVPSPAGVPGGQPAPPCCFRSNKGGEAARGDCPRTGTRGDNPAVPGTRGSVAEAEPEGSEQETSPRREEEPSASASLGGGSRERRRKN